MLTSSASETGSLADGAVIDLVARGLAQAPLAGQRVLVIVPDSTRTAPLPLMFRVLCDLLRPKVKKLDFLIALGTHPPMPEDRVNQLFGLTPEERRGPYAGAVGYFDFSGNMDTCIAIRTIVMQGDVAYLQAGAGLVAGISWPLKMRPADARSTRRHTHTSTTCTQASTATHPMIPGTAR